jgi:hypothetical protein
MVSRLSISRSNDKPPLPLYGRGERDWIKGIEGALRLFH